MPSCSKTAFRFSQLIRDERYRMNKCTRRSFLAKAGLGSASFLSACSLQDNRTPKQEAHAAADEQAGADKSRTPNILFFLVDDLGWVDSTVYGSRYYDTPNIEKLASRGMLFRNAYAANPLCSPTRASIMTGKYPCRLGITTPAGHLPPQPDTPLMGETAAPFRKMVTPRGKRFLPLKEYTIAEAFKAAGYRTGFIGKWHLGHEKWWPKKQGFDINIAGGHYPGPPSYFSPYRIKTLPDGPKGEYITDRLTDEAVGFLKEHRTNPFFLCFWHYAVHAPFQGKEALIKKYENRKDPRGKQDCPTMAAMIKSMDESLGRILDALKRFGLEENTIIIFTSDNGGNMYDRVKGTTPTNNFPLRNGKGNIHEGGVREPSIITWPGVVAPDSESTEIISSIDYYPTMLAMAGLAPRAGQQIDGVNLVPLLSGKEKLLDREAIFCHFPHYIPATGNLPATSVRKGKWKLIRFYGEGPGRENAYALYNLEEDIGESNNLAEELPEKVRELDALITKHLEETGALVPVKNPRYDPEAEKRRNRAQKPVAGWIGSSCCILSLEKNVLKIESTGEDPFIHTSNVPKVAGPLQAQIRYKSTAAGKGQFFWNTVKAKQFHRSRRITFSMQHDGSRQTAVVPFQALNKLTAVRLDPGASAGIIEIEWIRLQDKNGTLLTEWTFD